MAQLRLAMAQVNPVVGDLAGNARMVRDRVAEAAAAGAHLVAFPEMVLTAYPVEDLALRESFVEASRRALVRLAADLAADGSATCRWSSDTSTGPTSGAARTADPGRTLPQNCAAVIHGGRVVGRYAKHHLPNYGVFDEYRIFAPGESLTVVRVRGVDVAIAICEDLWQEGGPVAQTRDAGAELLLVINGSPYEREKDDTRLELVRRRAAQAGCTLAYLNMVGGQDELVFDGDSMVVGDRRGGARPRPAVRRVTWSSSTWSWPRRRSTPADLPEGVGPRRGVRRSRSTGMRRWTHRCTRGSTRSRRCGAPSGSGCGTTCARTGSARSCSACPAGSTRRSWRPSPPTSWAARTSWRSATRASTPSERSKDDAAELAKNLGLDYRVVPIQPMVDAVPRVPRTDRRRRGEPPGARPGRHLDGRLQPGGPTSSSPTPTRARCRSGTRRSTATAWAGSPRSRTCPRPWCGSSPAGATGMRRRAASRPRSRRRRSPSRRRPSCGRARPTRTPCRPTRSSTRFSPATSGWPTAGTAHRRRFRPGNRGQGHPARRPRGVEAAPVRPRPEDLTAGVRQGPAAADHQPVAGRGRGPVVTTAVQLRPWSADDLPVLERNNAPEMTVHLGGPESPEKVRDRHERYQRHWLEGTAWMFTARVDDEPVGLVGYWNTTHEGRDVFECAYGILPEFQGRGLAAAAMQACLAHAATARDARRRLRLPEGDERTQQRAVRAARVRPRGRAGLRVPEGPSHPRERVAVCVGPAPAGDVRHRGRVGAGLRRRRSGAARPG